MIRLHQVQGFFGAHPAVVVEDLGAVAAPVAAHRVRVGWDRGLRGYKGFYSADGNGNRVGILATVA